MVNDDLMADEINTVPGQSAKLGDPQSGMEQDIDPVIVAAEVLVAFDEGEEPSLLVPCDGLSCHAVIYNDGGKLEVKGILPNQIIIDGHAESRTQHTADRVDRAVALALFLLQFDQPDLRVGQFDFINAPTAHRVFF